MKSSAALLLFALALPASADEGMWLFDHFPKTAVKQKYGVDISDAFLENLRLASVQLAGGMGGFVSPEGLFVTNQHLVSGCLAKLSSASHDYLASGFYAASHTAELQCTELAARVLTSMEDVTEQVITPEKKGVPAAQVLERRKAAIAQLQRDCQTKSGEICEVVDLFSGIRYALYRYKEYRDVRLVFAPEQQLAFFGRERDSITYLRYGLDIAFLRAYENGRPAATPHYLKWSVAGVKEGDLVFASGAPHTTVRETTAAQLSFYRDTALPLELARLARRIRALNEFAAKSDRNRQLAQLTLTGFLENYKSLAGKLIGLRDDRLVLRKTAFDQKIRHAVEADPKFGTEGGKVWDQVAAAYKNWTPYEKAYEILEASPAPGSTLFHAARQLVRGQSAAGEIVVNEPLEIVLVAQYLDELKSLSEKDVPLKAILAGRTPEAAAEALVKSSHLQSEAERRRLAVSHDALTASDDGMIKLAMLLEPAAQRIEKKHAETIGALETSAAARIAQFRYLLFGDAQYPDANGTPRVEFGLLKSYADRADVNQPYAATFSGLYYRQNKNGPYQVPQRWIAAKSTLDEVTPLDFVSTCDIGGGDAGSPTVNRAGEFVGVAFDGNLESLPNTYLYTDEQARAVHVAAEGIAEALKKVYRADSLLRELGVPVDPGTANY